LLAELRPTFKSKIDVDINNLTENNLISENNNYKYMKVIIDGIETIYCFNYKKFKLIKLILFFKTEEPQKLKNNLIETLKNRQARPASKIKI